MRLTIAGIAECEGSDDDVDLFLRAVRWLARHEGTHNPDPDQTAIRVTRKMLARPMKVALRDTGRLRRLFEILQVERWGAVSSSRNGPDWEVQVGREVRQFACVHTVEDFQNVRSAWLKLPADAPRDAPELPQESPKVEGNSRVGFVHPTVIDEIEKYGGGKWDCSKLLGLIHELDENYRSANSYAAHALLRALLDHVPPLFGQTGFAGVVNNHRWGRTDTGYLKQLNSFRNQADEVLHRQISASPNILTIDDLPPRAALNLLLLACAAQLKIT
jgi:hypothetical protein